CLRATTHVELTMLAWPLFCLAAPDAGLGLGITRVEARRVERSRAGALTGRRLGRTIRRAGLGGALSESQSAGADRATICERGAKQPQQDGRGKGEFHVASPTGFRRECSDCDVNAVHPQVA